jgi:hypothetical protein
MQVRPVRRRATRAGLHLVAVTVLAGGSVLLTGAPGNADVLALPDSYGGDATASAFHYVFDRVPQPTPVTDAFHAELPYATTLLDSSGSATGSAAPLYPGAGPLGVPALICQFAARLCGSPFPGLPRYPFMATASYPTTPDDSADYSRIPAQSGGGLTFSPAVAEAHARENQVDALTEAASLGVTGAVSAVSAMTHSAQHFEGSTLVVMAETTVKGLDLGGGQLHIDQLHSQAVARVDGAKVTAASSSTTIAGATAGGQAITIDTTGFHAFGQGDKGAAQGQVNHALSNLAAHGINVRLLASTKRTKDGTAAATSGGLLITFTQDVNLPTVKPPPIPPVCLPNAPCIGGGIPPYNGTYFGSVTVGGAGVQAFATPAQQDVFPPVDTGGALPPVTSVGQSGTGTAPPLPTQPGTTGQGSSNPTLAGPAAHDAHPALLGLDLTGKRLRQLMLVLLGYPVLVLLGSPLRRSSRLRNASENGAL